ncbi:MAG: NADAR family protein [Eubacterium sp.]|nr:NADAR family protein [Eubacterium sp.]
MRIICFHNPDEEYGFLSNWYLSEFHFNGIRYSSMEQYMMHRKALTFHDNDIADQILATDDVSKIKALGRQVHNYNDAVWNGVRQVIVYQGLIEKFSQNRELGDQLLATGEATLAEAARTDRIWGIGLTMDAPERSDMAQWKGQNLLGFTLMLVREALRSGQ